MYILLLLKIKYCIMRLIWLRDGFKSSMCAIIFEMPIILNTTNNLIAFFVLQINWCTQQLRCASCR